MANTIVRKHEIANVKPGMELASSIIFGKSTVILAEGTILTPILIERLKQQGIDSLEVRHPISDSGKFSTYITPEQQKVVQHYKQTITDIKKSFEIVRYSKRLPLEEFQEIADTSIELFINTRGILKHLHIIRQQDDDTFHHSMNVAILCGVLGRWLGFDNAEYKKLVLAGLLHDIGKTQINLDILKKPSQLSSQEIKLMQLHSVRGYHLLNGLHIPPDIRYAALQHHEREDGSGYPLKVTGSNIHLFAKIVAVADLYDAITSDRVYKKKNTPFEAIEIIIQQMYHQLDPKICTVFLENTREYFIGTVVELNDGREAKVVFLGRTSNVRPMVVTLDGEFLDLEKERSLSIVKMISL